MVKIRRTADPSRATPRGHTLPSPSTLLGLLVTGRRTASVTATSPMRLFALFEQDFRRLCAEVPAFERRVREVMAKRLGWR